MTKKNKELIMVTLDNFNNRERLRHTNKFSKILDKIRNKLYKNNGESKEQDSQNSFPESQNSFPESQTIIEKHDGLEFERTFKDYRGVIIIRDSLLDQELGRLKYSVNSDSIEIDTIISYQKGAGTKLVEKIIELSKSEGKNGKVTAIANPFLISNKRSYRKEITNLGFYYKLGFRAKDEEIHQEIMEYLDSGEEIPINLNINTELIYNPN